MRPFSVGKSEYSVDIKKEIVWGLYAKGRVTF